MTNTIKQQYELCVPISSMRVAPSRDAECSNECLFGERIVSVATTPEPMPGTTAAARNEATSTASVGGVEQATSQWLHVITERDGYEGYIQEAHVQAINADTAEPTHWVCSKSTMVFSAASIKSPVLNRIPFLSKVTSHSSAKSPFRALDSGGFVWAQHLLEVGKNIDTPPLQLAQSHFLGTPYLWGGCTPEGVDCSGLIQALAGAHGIQIPRDSGDQERALSYDIAIGEQQTHDVVYWPGHTGILVDAETLLHATAYSLSCVVEPLSEVVERAGDITSIKRLFSS